MGVVVVVVGSHHFIASLVSVVVVASSPMGEQTTAMRVSFCLSLCLSSRIFAKSRPTVIKFSVSIRYVLPVCGRRHACT